MRGLSGVSKGRAATEARGGAARSASGFSVGGPGTAGAAAAGTVSVSAPAAVGCSLLAVQENGGRAGRDATARRRAASILDELQGLQAELLGGRADSARLARLAALQSGEDGADPGLRDAVRAVALRARIELARRVPLPPANRSTAVL